MIKQLVKALIGRCVTDYRINWIYVTDTPGLLPLLPGEVVMPLDDAARAALAGSPTYKMRNSLSFARAGLVGLVLVRDGAPLCVAHFASPAQYDRRATWPLPAGHMALMDIATEDAARGKGLAPRMIAAASRQLLGTQFQGTGVNRLIAFIWWSNTPSVRAFTKAGWRRTGLSLEWQFAGQRQSVRLGLPRFLRPA